jgi:hypothetical protein|tara:strand:+ start:372 stop:914 length:543 start_codon:yes stop_codon:yes gene_type:complete
LLTPLIQENLYRSQIDKNICDKAHLFISKHQEKFTHQTWDCKIRTSYSLTNNILNIKDLHELKMHVLSHINNYLHLKKYFTDGYIHSSWVNIYEKDFYQEFHDHEDPILNTLSGVIYLTENNSNIEFNVKNTMQFSPKFSDIILFPDHTLHRVAPNKNNSLRISLAFNFAFCKQWEIISL